MNLTMPFGKHRDVRIIDLPTGYLAWLVREQIARMPELAEAVEVEAEQRGLIPTRVHHPVDAPPQYLPGEAVRVELTLSDRSKPVVFLCELVALVGPRTWTVRPRDAPHLAREIHEVDFL